MEALENILVVIERGAEQYPEIERAAELAEASGAHVHLFVREYHAVLYWHYLFGKRGDKVSQAAYEREAQAWVDEQVRALTDQGIKASGEAAWARHLYTAIAERVDALQPELVIKGAHDERGVRSLYSATDWQLMRRCPVPVLLVKYQSRAQQGAILCSVHPAHPESDHHPVDHRIMELGQLMSEYLGRPQHLFNTFQSPAESVAPPIAIEAGAYEDYLEQHRNEHDRLLNEFVARYQLPEANVHRLEGDPSSELPSLAQRLPASMVIMGVVSRSALPELLVGHTAERVLDRLECDVLVVKPPAATAAS